MPNHLAPRVGIGKKPLPVRVGLAVVAGHVLLAVTVKIRLFVLCKNDERAMAWLPRGAGRASQGGQRAHGHIGHGPANAAVLQHHLEGAVSKWVRRKTPSSLKIPLLG